MNDTWRNYIDELKESYSSKTNSRLDEIFNLLIVVRALVLVAVMLLLGELIGILVFCAYL